MNSQYIINYSTKQLGFKRNVINYIGVFLRWNLYATAIDIVLLLVVLPLGTPSYMSFRGLDSYEEAREQFNLWLNVAAMFNGAILMENRLKKSAEKRYEMYFSGQIKNVVVYEKSD